MHVRPVDAQIHFTMSGRQSERRDAIVHVGLRECPSDVQVSLFSHDRRVLCAGFHKSAVLCVSAAMRRPLIATASKDNTVRIWDYQRMACITTLQATHPLATLAVHPWGTEMVISFRDSAHTYVIANELIAGQRLEQSQDGFAVIAYSPRGGLLACARKASVYVYLTNTYALVATLACHPEHVCELRWSADEVRLVSVCRAAVYTWCMETYTKVEEDTARAHTNIAAALDAAGTHAAIADPSGGLRLLHTQRAAQRGLVSGWDGGAVKGGERQGEVVSMRLAAKCAAHAFCVSMWLRTQERTVS